MPLIRRLSTVTLYYGAIGLRASAILFLMNLEIVRKAENRMLRRYRQIRSQFQTVVSWNPAFLGDVNY